MFIAFFGFGVLLTTVQVGIDVAPGPPATIGETLTPGRVLVGIVSGTVGAAIGWVVARHLADRQRRGT